MKDLNPFEEFLINKQKSQKKKINWKKRKKNWLNSIDSLYSDIEEWLKPFIEKELMEIKRKKLNLDEEYIGQYEVPLLDVYIGKDIISLKPKGTLILGSYGRIDMRGPKGEVMMIEQEWNNWIFAERTPKLETFGINEETFKSFIQKLA